MANNEESSEDIKELPDLPKIGRETVNCVVVLTDQEQIAKGRELADLLGENEILKAEKTAVGARIKSNQARIEELRTAVEFGRILKDVECKRFADYAEKESILIRMDTGEEVGRRPLTHDERQQEFQLDDERRDDQEGEPETD